MQYIYRADICIFWKVHILFRKKCKKSSNTNNVKIFGRHIYNKIFKQNTCRISFIWNLQFHIVILKIQAYEYLHKIFQSSDCYTHYHIFRLIYYKVHYPYTHPDIWHTFHRRHMSHHCKLLIISVMYITRKRQMKG